MTIGWRDDLAIGIKEVDDQHKELFRRFGELLKACNEGKGNQEVLGLLDFLDGYVLTHFSAEEKLQRDCGFPEYVPHRTAHQGFVDQLNDLKKKVREGGVGLSLVLSTNLVMIDWLTKHIEKMDREIAYFLQKQAAK